MQELLCFNYSIILVKDQEILYSSIDSYYLSFV